jgi:hypothetical protein
MWTTSIGASGSVGTRWRSWKPLRLNDRGRPDSRQRHRTGARAVAGRRRDQRTRHVEERRRRLDEGPLPVPRRAIAVVQRHPGPRLLALLRLWRGWRRHQLRAEDRPPVVHRSGRALGGPRRLRAALRAGRVGSARAAGSTRPSRRGPQGGRGLLRRAVDERRGRHRPHVPRRARFRFSGGRPLRRRLRTQRLGAPRQTPAGSRFHR